MTRRRWMWGAPLLAAFGIWWWRRGGPVDPRLPASVSSGEVSIQDFAADGTKGSIRRTPKVIRPDAEWQARLEAQQYYVTRTGFTDTPFTGSYYRLHDDGLFRCICCENALFSSLAKYDSGTGWPSFWEPIALENVRIRETFGVPRQAALTAGLEVLCALCDAHLGHIFDDGPAPSHLRYCINESALRFVPRSAA